MNKFEDVLKNQRPRNFITGFALMIASLLVIFVLWNLAQVSAILGLALYEMMPALKQGASFDQLEFIDKVTSLAQLPQNSFAAEVRFAVFVLFFSFGIGLVTAIFWRKIFEKLPIITLFSGAGYFRFKLFFLGALIAPLIIIISSLLSLLAGENSFATVASRYKALGFGHYIILLPIYFIAFGVQSTFEEVFIRAGFMQHLRRIKAPIWLAVIISNGVFGMLHFQPGIDKSVLLMTGFMGLSFAYSTWRTNGIELSMGAHILNNFMVGAIIGQMDNKQIGDEAYLGGFAYLIFFIGLLELFLKLFPDFLKEKPA
jgi:membrane protease YdiL (CAAX protease family)